MIVINFKTYKQGVQVVKLAKKISKVDKKAILCLQAVDIYPVSKSVKNPIFAQHSSSRKKGRNTGYIILESIKSEGGVGTLLNHSEHRISLYEIKLIINRCKTLGLKEIVFAGTLNEVKKIKKLNPWVIAYEDPYLVGSGKPITKYKSQNVKKFADLLKGTKIIPLCGAGISSKEDIIAAKKLGCKGVVIGSAIARDEKVEMLR